MATYERWSHREVRLYYKYPIVLYRAAKGTMESRFALSLRSFSIEYAREKKIARRVSKRLKALLTTSTMVHLRQAASFWFNLSRFIRSSWFQVLNILIRQARYSTKRFFYSSGIPEVHALTYLYTIFLQKLSYAIVSHTFSPLKCGTSFTYLLIGSLLIDTFSHGELLKEFLYWEAPPRGLTLY